MRSIIELIDYYKETKTSYSQEDFGIVLIVDGIAKLPTKFAEVLKSHDLFDEKLCHNKVARMDANNNHVLRKFTKTITTLESDEVSSPSVVPELIGVYRKALTSETCGSTLTRPITSDTSSARG